MWQNEPDVTIIFIL